MNVSSIYTQRLIDATSHDRGRLFAIIVRLTMELVMLILVYLCTRQHSYVLSTCTISALEKTLLCLVDSIFALDNTLTTCQLANTHQHQSILSSQKHTVHNVNAPSCAHTSVHEGLTSVRRLYRPMYCSLGRDALSNNKQRLGCLHYGNLAVVLEFTAEMSISSR